MPNLQEHNNNTHSEICSQNIAKYITIVICFGKTFSFNAELTSSNIYFPIIANNF